ncbi:MULTISPECIES: acyl-CoA thioesterase [Nocardia]|uniref:acyl-CoA thioesterase n=1 Tax=Nocardia abscessus TaxID=120957 RepID=UPI0018951D56|nr:acyl-CoA thioesterase domain-containing protein [Nocardia abscessus]MBF6472457.1 thioesterase family protein [Nocardia abscessus]
MPQNVETARAPFGTLAEILTLDRIGEHHFRAAPRSHPSRRKFGGETMAQAAVAAASTVEADRPLHAVHTHFLGPADSAAPTVYTVTRLRDGRSFTARRVQARQDDRQVADTTLSFHRQQSGFTHDNPFEMPAQPGKIPDPAQQLAGDAEILDWYLDLAERGAVEFRFPGGPYRARVATGERTPRHQSLWLRSATPLPPDPTQHQAALLYLTDYLMLGLAAMHHGVTVQDPGAVVATVNHSVWFHAPGRADDWVLHQQHTPWAGSGRALTEGQLYAADGHLLATTRQEGVISHTR